jgi:hypothetical protein
MAILIYIIFSLLAIKKTLQNHLIFEFLVFGEINKKRRGWVLLLLRQDSDGNSSRSRGFRYYCGKGRRQAKQASKASKKAH